MPILPTHPGWALVFSDGLFLVFVRERGRDCGNTYGATGSTRGSSRGTSSWRPSITVSSGCPPRQTYNTMANMYLVMGQRDNAIEILRKGVEETGNPFLREPADAADAGRAPAVIPRWASR